jgi:hypothetical protein
MTGGEINAKPIARAKGIALIENGIETATLFFLEENDLPAAFLPLDLANSETTCITPSDLLNIRRYVLFMGSH